MRRTTGCSRSALSSSIMEALVCPSPLPLCIFLHVHGQTGHSFKGTALQEDSQCDVRVAARSSPAF